MEITQLHDEIFDFLFEKHLEARARGEEFYFRVDNTFLDDEIGHILAISFWRNNEGDFDIYLLVDAKTTNVFLWGKNNRIVMQKSEDGTSDNKIFENARNKQKEANNEFKKMLTGKGDLEKPFPPTDIFHAVYYYIEEDAFPKYVIKYYSNYSSILENIEDFLNEDKPKIDNYFGREKKNSLQRFYAELKNEKKRQWDQSGKAALLPFMVRDFAVVKDKGINLLNLQKLPLNSQWIFLTGKNAYGKTSFLQTLAEGLYGIRNDKKLIMVGIIANNQYSLFINSPSYSFENIAAYGTDRLRNAEVKNNISHLFDEGGLNNIEEKLFLLGQNKTELAQNQYNILKQAIESFLPIEVKLGSEKNLFFEKDEAGNAFESVDFGKLAAGYKSIIYLVCDIILRLSLSSDEIKKPQDLAGIVIIDEIELHLHPENQKLIVEKLTEVFPKVQFIVSTHSPIPLLGAPKESVILHVDRTQEEGITVERLDNKIKWQNLTTNTLFSSPIFGYTDIFPNAAINGNGPRTEYVYNEILLNDEIEKRLKAFENGEENIFENLFD